MKVHELIEVLSKFPSDMNVEIDVDNGYDSYSVNHLEVGKSGMTKEDVVIIY